MRKNKIVLAAPVLKWVGGKRQLMSEIENILPKTYTTYYEPFIGGGAVLFELQPNKAVINDVNGELINLYNVIKDDVELLIEDLRKHENTSEYFYRIREQDRDRNEYEKLSKIEKASRVVYLNKTCFNGLFRVNKAGEFNSPFGKYKNPNIVDEVTLRAVSKYFNKSDIKILNCDFEQSLKNIRKGSFVYLDPPYDPVSSSANFTGYDKGGFNRDEQIRLKKLCDKLDKKGVKFLLSNSATDFIKELYKDYNIKIVKAKRAINSNGNSRGEVDEVLVRNYE
ncbi:DNA adenine methylase [Clostridium algidicarnis]|uniref:Site-specific DNA-methyltransferase (adenine-specific) n=2 Tax=Clostridium algidicarnis TaxID=37659 RepID=A0A2S6FVG7_9CLOT|nr:DNA adenine methylase [Clostridium algidicarnis]MBU3197645.1 DNA adenine methylase [Clostridium algidicarnis]MBU3221093.1 DNA adenine methylase [Clostridium algidicarnis]PPK45555.1 DNA adenine methylase [Clostridium algidicarnis DSM 15099]